MADMNDNRAQILAGFCGKENGKYPTTPNQLADRAIRIHGLARWCVKPGAEDDDLDAGELFDMSSKEIELEAEAQAMVTDGLLYAPQPHLIGEHERPPEGVYQLTLKGRTAAFAVLKHVQAQEG